MKKTTLCLFAITLCACQTTTADTANNTHQPPAENGAPVTIISLFDSLSHQNKSESNNENIQNRKLPTVDNPSLLSTLPDTLTTLNEPMSAFTYTWLEGLGAGGNPAISYTRQQIEELKQSPWNLTQFTDTDRFPIYRKTALSLEELDNIAAKLALAFNPKEITIQIDMPEDFHDPRFERTKDSISQHSQLSYHGTLDEHSFTINQHGTISLRVRIPYPLEMASPYIKNSGPYSEFLLDSTLDLTDRQAFFTAQTEAMIKNELNTLIPLEAWTIELKEQTNMSITQVEAPYVNVLVYQPFNSKLTLPQQLFASRF